MIEIERRIYVGDDISKDEYAYMHGEKSKFLITFNYYNVKRDRLSHTIYKTYPEALAFARDRARDGRYKNYEFFIGLYPSISKNKLKANP